MHEQSETIQNPAGQWVNVYGRNTPQAGQQLPGTPTYGTVDAAVAAAKLRSQQHGANVDNLEQGYQASLKSLEAGYQGANPSPLTDPTKGPVPVGVDTPNQLGRILGIARENRLVSPEAKIAMVTPGAGSFLARLGLAGAGQAAGSAARGDIADAPKKAAQGILGQAAGEVPGAIRGLLPTGSGALGKFAADVEGKLTDFLRQRVPALQGISSLRDMLYGQGGHDAVHQAYDAALQQVLAKAKGQKLSIPVDAADALGLGGTGGFQFPAHLAQRMGGGPLNPQAPGTISVDAAEAAKAMTGAWKKHPEAFRAVADALDAAGIGDPAARAAYKTYMGTKGLIDKTGGMPEGKLDLQAAQRGLNTAGPNAEVTRRGLEGDLNKVLIPSGKPITEGTMRGPGAALGAAAGALGSAGLHLPIYAHGGGLVGGAFLGSHLGSKIPRYTNVPTPPINPDVAMLLQRYLQAAGQHVASTSTP